MRSFPTQTILWPNDKCKAVQTSFTCSVTFGVRWTCPPAAARGCGGTQAQFSPSLETHMATQNPWAPSSHCTCLHIDLCPSPETGHCYEAHSKMTSCTFLKALLSAIFTLEPAAQASASSRGQGMIQRCWGGREEVVRKEGSTSQMLGGNSTALCVQTEIRAGCTVPRAREQFCPVGMTLS